MVKLGDDVVIGGTAEILDDARVIDHATVTGGALLTGWCTIRDNAFVAGHVQVSGLATIGGDVVLTGVEQIHADGLVLSQDDVWVTLPPGEIHPWTIHRRHGGGWMASAGCVRGVDLSQPFDLSTHPPRRLARARQEHYLWVQQQCQERDGPPPRV